MSTRTSARRRSRSQTKITDSQASNRPKKQTKKIQKQSKTPNDIDSGLDMDSGPWYWIFTKGDKEYDTYMGTEWGFEKRGDVALFEKLALEGAQSGLSWLTILRKRNAYRRTFHNFEIDKVASMSKDDVERILSQTVPKGSSNDTGDADPKRAIIVRHRGKVESVIQNAKCIQKLYQEQKQNMNASKEPKHGVLDDLLWSFVENKPILNTKWDGKSLKDAPAKTAESEAMSNALKKLGFRFVGPTTCYAMMQSVGMVIDHPIDSPEWKEAKKRLEDRPDGYQMR